MLQSILKFSASVKPEKLSKCSYDYVDDAFRYSLSVILVNSCASSSEVKVSDKVAFFSFF